MNITRRFTSVLLLLALAACGPAQPYYETHYELVAPPTEQGRMCANNCLSMQQNCRMSCNQQSQQCQQMDLINQGIGELQASRDYEDYVRQCKRDGKPVVWNRASFRQQAGNNCAVDGCYEQCANDYRICHVNCGGQAIPHTSCVANCNGQ